MDSSTLQDLSQQCFQMLETLDRLKNLQKQMGENIQSMSINLEKLKEEEEHVEEDKEDKKEQEKAAIVVTKNKLTNFSFSLSTSMFRFKNSNQALIHSLEMVLFHTFSPKQTPFNGVCRVDDALNFQISGICFNFGHRKRKRLRQIHFHGQRQWPWQSISTLLHERQLSGTSKTLGGVEFNSTHNGPGLTSSVVLRSERLSDLIAQLQKLLKGVNESGHFNVFVGDLSPEVTDATLFACFSVYPNCLDARVMWDQKTGCSKGYGFVSFHNQQDAQGAINELGRFLSDAKVRDQFLLETARQCQETGLYDKSIEIEKMHLTLKLENLDWNVEEHKETTTLIANNVNDIFEPGPNLVVSGGMCGQVWVNCMSIFFQSTSHQVLVVCPMRVLQDAAVRVGGWISGAYVDRLHVEVAAVPEDVGTAGALRAIAPHLTAKDIMVVSGDLISDVPPGAVAAAYRRHDAVVTATLCSTPINGPSDSGGKDKTKKPGRYNLIGLDPTKQFLLYIATGAELEKDIRIQKSILRAVGQMEIRADLMDAHLYAFKRSVLQEVLDQKNTFQSLRQDVLPYMVGD